MNFVAYIADDFNFGEHTDKPRLFLSSEKLTNYNLEEIEKDSEIEEKFWREM